jgi:2-polyprenyl-3-methyl-5-hydroxy-6-metoxy-1,4-benzoquinol methylase
MDRHAHWEQVYRTKGPDQVSWFQAEARLSQQLIETAVPDRSAAIIDVGAGASTLIDGLVAAGYRQLTVVDLSEAALEIARRRLGAAAAAVTWQAADVLEARFPHAHYDVWHDRAVFHFLTTANDRERYVAQVRHTLRPGGHVLVATFAEDGPTRCSGLDVARYSAGALHEQFGADFALLASHREEHTTPSGSVQAFTYCLCRFQPQVISRSAA